MQCIFKRPGSGSLCHKDIMASTIVSHFFLFCFLYKPFFFGLNCAGLQPQSCAIPRNPRCVLGAVKGHERSYLYTGGQYRALSLQDNFVSRGRPGCILDSMSPLEALLSFRGLPQDRLAKDSCACMVSLENLLCAFVPALSLYFHTRG